MRKILKRLSVLICGWLVAVCALSTFKSNKDSISTPTRDVELVEQNIDFNTFYNSFENASFNVDKNIANFKGDKKISDYDLSFLDNISNDNVEITNQFVSFDFKYNYETSMIIVEATYVNNQEILIDKLIGFVFENDNGETDAIITLEDDSTILLSELQSKYIDECGWLSKLIKATASVVVAAVVVAVLPVSIPVIVAATVTYAAIETYEYIQAKNNYNHNKSLTEPNSYINGQNSYSDWKFGASTMDNNGCGIIATYNVLLGLNKRKDLADIAYSFDKNSGTIVSGIFGADPTHYSIYFRDNNISYTKYTSYNSLQEGISNMSNNQMILVCAWNGDSITDGAHYVAASYTSGNTNPISVYNLYGNRIRTYNYSIFDKSIIGGNLITAYIVG